MGRLDPRLVLGLLLIAGGVLFLLQNFGLIPGGLGWLWALVMAGAGAAFVAFYLANRAQWWALIPGLVLFDLALLIAVGEFAPAVAERWGGGLFLAGLSLPFWAIYALNREHWWSLIPAGVMMTLGLVAGLSDELDGTVTGGVFFLGLGLTFGLVWLAPTPQGRQAWAVFPALGLLVFGGLLATPFATLASYVGPAALVLGGLILIFRSLRPRPQ
jgi:hypothetical protein